ncbi:MAG: diguanylate cyclase [Lachnospiraceae bacterium]|nr:diguanylate cyclase [Lachnospiraceae bacterium]
MKKSDFIYKTIQLSLYILLAGFCLFIILSDGRLYHQIASDPGIRLLCFALWLTLGLSFLFIYKDFSVFSSFKKDYRELNYSVHADSLSGIANRFSCDVMIEKYLDKQLPQNLGCIMFDLSNVAEINKLYGHLQGNRLIRDFSNILNLASSELCFVGRNGGNQFLSIFENGSREKMDLFLERVSQKVQAYNQDASSHLSIKYHYGTAFHESEEIQTITDLIALSSRRISRQHKKERTG